jgi:hypothetical protein
MLEYILYCLAGLLQDIILTGLTFATVKRKAWAASTLSFANTVLSGTVWITLLKYVSDSFLGLLSYAIGGSIGTALVIFYYIYKEKGNGYNK